MNKRVGTEVCLGSTGLKTNALNSILHILYIYICIYIYIYIQIHILYI